MLPAGLKLALLPKKTRGDTVRGQAHHAIRRREDADEPRRHRRRRSGEMLQRGTTKHTRQQIQDEFDRLKARVNIQAAPT